MDRIIRLTTSGCCLSVLMALVSGCAPASTGDERTQASTYESVVRNDDNSISRMADSSEQVRSDAHRELEAALKRKIYFDPSASASDRAQAIEEVQAMWRNLQEKDLVEYAQNRMPIGYFYDLNTGELFEERAGNEPIETSSGSYLGMPAGVRAIVFACENCGKDRYVAWLEVPNTELARYGIPYETNGNDNEPGVMAVRTPEGDAWHLHGTRSAEAITESARRCSQSAQPLVCRPGR